jgi:hypothetical protein
MHATLLLAALFDKSDPIESSIGLSVRSMPAYAKGRGVLSYLGAGFVPPHW